MKLTPPSSLPLFGVLTPDRNTTAEPPHLYAAVVAARKKQHRVSRQGRHVVLDGRRLTWSQFGRVMRVGAEG